MASREKVRRYWGEDRAVWCWMLEGVGVAKTAVWDTVTEMLVGCLD